VLSSTESPVRDGFMNLKILKSITHNWHIKLISIVLAGILWIYISSIQEKERFLSVPVKVMNVPRDYLVASELPEFVQLILRGRDEYLSLVNEEDIIAFIDLEMSTKLSMRKIVRIDKKGIPRGVLIKEITPRLIDIQVEKAQRKEVKVVPVIIAELPDGYEFEDVIIEPDSVEIQGPESLLDAIDSIYTKNINIRNLTETTVMETVVDTANEKISLVGEQSVNVKIVIREEFAVKRVSPIIIYPINVTEGLVPILSDQEISVLIKIPRRLEREFSDQHVYGFVDCINIEIPGEYILPVTFQSDIADIVLVKIEPQSALVRLEEFASE
jgi:YbbR domain-containing protein